VKRSLALWCLTAALLACPMAYADDWPQWGGPNRDHKSAETGLLKTWPAGGPKLLWATTEDLGKGHSSIVITRGAIYTTGMLGRKGYVFAFDMNGKLKWKSEYGPDWRRNAPGSRTTPTIDGDRAYVMSGRARIACFDVKDGKQKWAVDTVKAFGARRISWGISESPLVCENIVICTPGGRDASLVAFDKMTGKTVWRTKGLSDKSAYCSPIRIKDDKKDLIVTMTESHIVGVNVEDGSVLWKHRYQGKCRAHPNTPLYKDGQIYATSGYNDGGVALKLAPDGKRVELLWKEKKLDTHHGGIVLVDGFIYGSNWLSNVKGRWACVDWKTGQLKYETAWENKGSIIYADGMLYCYEEKRGTVALVKPTPKGFEVVSSFRITKGSGKHHWAHPAIADGRLYIRRGKTVMAFDIKE